MMWCGPVRFFGVKPRSAVRLKERIRGRRSSRTGRERVLEWAADASFSRAVDRRLRRLSASHLAHLVVLAGLPVVALRLRLALGLTGSRPLVLVAVSVLVLVVVLMMLLLLLLLSGVLSSSSLQRSCSTETA